MTPSQLADSANAPWTRTIVGCMKGPFGWVIRVALGVDRVCSSQDRTAAPVVTRPSRAGVRESRLGRGLGCLPDAGSAPQGQAARTMLTPKVTPIRHTGPSPHAPL